MTTDLNKFINASNMLLTKKQRTLRKWFKLDTFDNCTYDSNYTTLELKNTDNSLIFKTMLMGCYCLDSRTWFWGWDDKFSNNASSEIKETSKQLWEFTGISHFMSPSFSCTKIMANELCAMYVKHIDALGMYKITEDNKIIYLALIDTKDK